MPPPSSAPLCRKDSQGRMSNIVQFPLASAVRSRTHVGARLLNEPPPRAHAVQFYDDATFLFDTVALFVRSGLEAGDTVVLIATPDHTNGILSRMDGSTSEFAIDAGRLVLLDAEAMLSRFMIGERPVGELFMSATDRLLTNLQRKLAPGR